MEAEHGYDGTRFHESANYEGYVHVCLCGERFMERSELEQHCIEEANRVQPV